jgi:GntR family transcriptional regulator, transcriptional repressor for pyruvate dehydrogenase complex
VTEKQTESDEKANTDYAMLFEPVKNKRTFEEVSGRIKELIFNGTLEPGQQLPSEQALARLFRVGRQSVREALRVLELSGFIQIRSGAKGGATIQSTMLSKLSRLFLETTKLHKVSLEDCFTARRAIEVSVLDLAIQNAEDEDVDILRANIVAARKRLLTGEPAYEENIGFHRLLAKASRNHTFEIVMESILAVFADLKSRYTSVELNESRGIVDLHEAIVDALMAKKKVDAFAALTDDLAAAEMIMLTREKRVVKK